MKICKNCNKQYEFYGQRVLLCKPCRTAYNREYYRSRSNKWKKRKQLIKLDRVNSNKKFIREYKEAKGCLDCGISDFRVLEFDHLLGEEKEHNIATMIGHGYSLENIMKETEKCEVVCSNCHRIRTYERLNNPD
jgi:hypothetical protein